MSDYRIIVGLEVHVELDTATKMFCRCVNDPFYAEKPNQHVCPVCLGLPGALPVPNREAVRKTILVGLALGAEINPVAKWDRKHYFYPDLPKGYQISQFDLPFCVGGAVELLDEAGNVSSTVRFERAHLEEDAGKLLHGSKPGYSRVDLNRAGVPLLEMVTLPDLTSAAQARAFLQEVQLIMRTLGVSNADMEKGQLRCDVNINIAFEHEGKEVRTPITEVKNVNSSRAVERAITTESERQYREWQDGGKIRTRTSKITAGWDEDANQVTVQRAKEGSADYRYMPEPDLPPVLAFEDAELNPEMLRAQLPVLPNQIRHNLREAGVAPKDTETLLADAPRLKALETIAALDPKRTKAIANWLINADGVQALEPQIVLNLVTLAEAGDVSFSAVKPKLSELTAALANQQKPLKDVLAELNLLQVHNDAVVQSAVEAVLRDHAAVVEKYRAGDHKVLGFLIGQIMKQVAGKAQPAKVQEALIRALS